MEAEMWNNRHTYGWAAVSRLNVDSTLTSSIRHIQCVTNVLPLDLETSNEMKLMICHYLIIFCRTLH